MLSLLPSDANAESYAWKTLHYAGPAQSLLHNELVKRIEADRSKLETCLPAEVTELQAAIRARRELLAFLHSRDSTDNRPTQPLRNPLL